MSTMDNLDWREPANDNTKRCENCGGEFGGNQPKKRFCSEACQRAEYGRRIRGDKERRLKSAPERVCENCGVAFKRRPDKKNAARFCSRACGYAAKANVQWADPIVDDELRAQAEAQRFSIKIAKCLCVDCGERFRAKSLATKRCASCAMAKYIADNDNGRDRSARPCATCGVVFSPEYGDRRRIYCSSDCSRVAAVEASKETGRKAANRLTRRLAERAATVEQVNPLKVFDRDKWRCQLCGVRTPKRLRGTCEPNAPELDHILPISLGGEHSYRNTQCACRKCNGSKGATPMGQMLLFG